MNDRCPTGTSRVPESAQRKLARYAEATTRAIVIGDRNGLIEWTNDAWSRVTGFALEESLGKPIGDFVQQAEIDSSLVEFIASSFRAGEVCSLVLPLRTPEGDDLCIDLRVEPLLGPDGEPSDFVAIASDATSSYTVGAEVECCDVSAVASQLCSDLRPRLGDRSLLEVEIDIGIPLAGADSELLSSLALRAGLRAISDLGSGWGTLTIGAGILGRGAGPLFEEDPEAALAPGQYAYLEIHDSGPESGPLRPTGLGALFAASGTDPALALSDADRLLRGCGGAAFACSTPWQGTSVLLVVPIAAGTRA